MRNRLPSVLLGVWAAALVSGCAEPPTARVEAAKERLAALAGEAETYAPAAHKAAQDAAAQLDADLAAQEQRFSVMRSYTRTEELVASVEAAADTLQQAIDAEKTRLRAETERLITDAKNAVASAQESIAALPAREVAADQGAAWQSDLGQVGSSLEEVNKLVASGQFAEARRQADSAERAAAQVGTAVANVQAEIEKAREEQAARAARGDVTIPRAVTADGKPLGPGTYRLRLAEEVEAPAGTQRWVEFLRNGAVAGRALAVMVADADIREIANSPGPRNAVRVEELRGGEYVRVWLNRDGVNYLLHLPIAGR